MSISQVVTDFTTLAIQAGGWMEMDRLYVQNRLLHLIGEDSLEETTIRPVTEDSLSLL
ncbi:MAG TPA: UDP-glucose--hexose-1-phosphate uridylyltransferase, partial [Enterococcus columbae]|nr:UDP-glucose--hexose-1-phosphate uridylyltransferase [Enterococcus columbae]